MVKLVKSPKIISLKDNKEINEAMIQDFIFNNPSVLGLGELQSSMREKAQSTGGRLDILLKSSDGNVWYEVEIQLGATDPSHIIRTIEYWDTERKRNRRVEHCAVIVAEDITNRFYNVIQLFNGNIPLIAIQMKGIKRDDDTIELFFTRVIDKVISESDEDENLEVTDRKYWEDRSTKAIMNLIDEIHKDIASLAQGYVLNYNKFYVGLSKDGKANNFVSFTPRKKFVRMSFVLPESDEFRNKIDDAGIDYDYDSRYRSYRTNIRNINEYQKHRDIFELLIKKAIEEHNITQD